METLHFSGHDAFPAILAELNFGPLGAQISDILGRLVCSYACVVGCLGLRMHTATHVGVPSVA